MSSVKGVRYQAKYSRLFISVTALYECKQHKHCDTRGFYRVYETKVTFSLVG